MSYTKYQIALTLYPDMTEETASRQLRRAIHDDPELLGKLRACGYKNRNRKITDKQYKIIMDYLE